MHKYGNKNYWRPTMGGNDIETRQSDFPHKESDFPYRKYKLESKVKKILEIILSSDPNVYKKEWKLPEHKVEHKLPTNIFYLSNIVVGPTLDNHWEYDQIVDYYSEEARIKTPGYGEKYSVWEYWNNPLLHRRWKRAGNGDNRELLYDAITEARPAYSTVAISLYKALYDFTATNNTDISILDIAAYGERAIAAAALWYNYDGVDPNYDLINGLDNLTMDLKCLRPEISLHFYHVGLEDYKSCKLYDIITYSPPPFNTELYASNKELQSYTKYPTFEEYLCCFLTEIIYKAYKLCKIGAVFSITALDRNPKYFPLKISIQYMSDHTELIYVEAMLLIIASFGFEYKGAIGLSVGNKPPQVPWWTFIKQENDFTSKCITMLKQYYPTIYYKVGPRCLSVVDNTVFTVSIHEYIENDNVFNISKHEFTIESSVKLELIRYQIQMYIINMVHEISNMSINRINTILGRYLMLRSITGTYEEPWKSCLYVDPVFPTSSKHVVSDIIEDQIIQYFDLNGAKIIKDHVYWFKSYTCKGITQLYNTVAQYIRSLPLSTIETSVKTVNDQYVITTKGLQNIPGYKSNVFTFKQFKNIDILTTIRYETLGAKGHQHTRPIERTKIIENIFNQSIMDIYASAFNNNSTKYCSIYPDVELNAYGSAFCLKMIEGAYLANPVDVPVFIEKALNNIINDLTEAKKNSKSLKISMAFTLWLDTNPTFVKDFNNTEYSILLNNTDNIGLKRLSGSEFIRAIYILGHQFGHTIVSESSNSHRNTISVGVILTSLNNDIDLSYLPKLTDNKKFIIV